MKSIDNSLIDKISKLSANVISLLNSDCTKDELMQKIVLIIQSEFEFESVGIRLKEGLDYPYFFSKGFNQDFVEKEMYLCSRDENDEILLDTKGKPCVECMCGNIIEGRTNSEFPFFSEGGSFWSNCTTELLATSTDQERQTRTRNRCNGEGYESVGLFPIKNDNNIYGLIQLNDRRKNMFDAFAIPFFENIGKLLGLLFLTRELSNKYKTKFEDTQRLLTVRISMLEKISKLIKDRILDLDLDLKDNSVIINKIDEIVNEIGVLKGIGSICTRCKKVRNEQGYWEQMESFISNRSKFKFSHAYCEDCYEKEMESIRTETNQLFNHDSE
ncbi:MAG: hypothetical protein GY797_27435 [Deltaproteobacteria bacterium]|nr:hypothetical protein [Deltaproteobacteria bacterium]